MDAVALSAQLAHVIPFAIADKHCCQLLLARLQAGNHNISLIFDVVPSERQLCFEEAAQRYLWGAPTSQDFVLQAPPNVRQTLDVQGIVRTQACNPPYHL